MFSRILSSFLLVAALALPSAAQAEVPPYMQYQGYLTSMADEPVSGFFSMTFGLYREAEGGEPVWSEERDRSFEGRLKRAGFQFDHIRSGRGGRRHPVYIATASPDASRPGQGGGNGSSPLRRGARRRR